ECLNPYGSGKSPQQSKKSRPWLLVDCGEGTQQQLLHTKLSLHQLAAICITHVHGDHCYGLPGLLASAAMSGRCEPLTVIAPQAIATLLEAISQTTELYLPFAVNFMAIEDVLSEQGNTNKVDIRFHDQHQLTVDIHPLSHRVASYGFGITQTINRRTLDTDKLRAENIPASALWGKLQQGQDVITEEGRTLYSDSYVINDPQRTRIVVAGDNDTPGCLTPALVDTDLLVHEATYTHEVLTKIQAKNPDFDPMHSIAKLVGSFAQEAGLENLILTHFSARYQSFDNPDSSAPNMASVRLDAEKVYQGSLWLAADFDQYLVDGSVDLAEDQHPGRVQYLGSALGRSARDQKR
ncbi:MAG: MBL fold metallo-hydrolase, partial [Psychrobacter sp.]